MYCNKLLYLGNKVLQNWQNDIDVHVCNNKISHVEIKSFICVIRFTK